MERLFLGIADINYCAFVVVGDASGAIISTGVGGSVNHRRWGIRQARENLKGIIEAVGSETGTPIGGISFTCIKGHLLSPEDLLPLISGLVEESVIHVEDFATTAVLGIHSPKERVFLMGDHVGLAILQGEGGRRHEVRRAGQLWDPSWIQGVELGDQCLFAVAKSLDNLIEEGSPWALGAACDIACELVRLVLSLGSRFSRPDPVIGLYGPWLLGSETIRQRVRYLLELLFPQAELVDTPLAPAKGAYLAHLLTRKKGLKQEVLTTFYNSARSVLQRGWLDFVANY